ncbi:zinc/manganese transport system substrate-binding protein [Izhakiella capsodis]|uniref:Zinc/manganese transport system substrate-binding protein n=1 Tax=Izhakiella capsodis TaxID=1367852 RepID=A0A1I4YEY5_9GAMM|nr:metal ABC transporter substrate-binding protein [Izhakiella capsodis]SFN36584.1 zinc/manganese transport system substrate-binding protein [Izhakiella capsodis]
MKKFPLTLAVAALSVSAVVQAKTVDAVASFSILGDIVKQVGGEHVVVKTLVGPNGDPHTFEPTPQDAQALSKANVVFISGLGLEGWINRLISASGYHGKVIVASDGVSTRSMEEDGKQITDPHAWNSMKNGIIYAQNVMNALIAADPNDAAYFRQHGTAYIEKLRTLDHWALDTFEKVPPAKRKVLTSHDAFGYFGQRYGITFLSPVGFSTQSEASASDVAKLINQLKQEKIHTYFIENQTDPRLVKQIASASDAKPGGELYPEALSNKGGVAATYIQAFEHNVKVLAAGMK